MRDMLGMIESRQGNSMTKQFLPILHDEDSELSRFRKW